MHILRDLFGARARPSSLPRPRLSQGLAAVLLLVAATAHAQPSPEDKAAAEVLFEDGRKLSAAGDYEGAAKKLEASQRLDAGVGTLLYLADAYEKGGRTASAWATFREAASAAKASGQVERESVARTRAAALEPKLRYLTIALAAGADAPGLVVRKNGAEVKGELLGSAVPTDPGTVLIEVTATGKKPWKTAVVVDAAPGKQAFEIPRLEDAPAPPPPPPQAAPLAPAPAAPARDEAPAPGGKQRLLGGVAAGLGVVSIGVSGFFLARALGKDSQADDHCDGTHCRDQEGVTLANDARSAADLCGVFFGAGAVLLAGGGALYLTAPSGPEPERAGRVRLVPIAGPGAVGVGLGGEL